MSRIKFKQVDEIIRFLCFIEIVRRVASDNFLYFGY